MNTNAAPKPIGMITVLTPAYDPVRALRAYPDTVHIAGATLARNVRLPFPPANPYDLATWLDDNMITIVSSYRVGQRNISGRWHGRYNLILAQRQ